MTPKQKTEIAKIANLLFQEEYKKYGLGRPVRTTKRMVGCVLKADNQYRTANCNKRTEKVRVPKKE